MPNPNSHYFEVTISVSDFQGKIPNSDRLQFTMPVWTPGSYLVREFSRNVLDFEAVDLDSLKPLKSKKTRKNSWAVDLNNATRIEVKYTVYAFEFTVDTSFLDNLHGIINGASVFMYVEGLEHESFTLTVQPFREWKTIATGLRQTGGSGGYTFSVPNYDILVDSPIEVGNQKIHYFDVEGVRHDVSIYSQREFDQDKFVSDLKKIVEATIRVFSQIPYDRYVFLVDVVGDVNGGGLEHLNSTLCVAQMFALEPVQEYRRLLSLFNHEFFHAWNVKRMRPVGLGPFDYGKETYTNSLWVAEGLTSYYDDLLLRRAKIFSVGEYLDAFAVNLDQMMSLPGWKWQSAEEASFDTWIKHYRQNENSQNVLSSYYLQGTIIGWMLDMEIRRTTSCNRNLDDVMRKVYSDTFVKQDRGYTDEEFESACLAVADSREIRRVFDDRVKGRKPVSFERCLGYAGLKITPKKNQPLQAFLGAKAREDSGRVIASNVLSSSAAEESGLSPGDEIIGVDGLRTDKAKLVFYLSNRKPEETISLLIARSGAIVQLKAKLTEKPVFEYRILKKDAASDAERQLFKSWLDEDWEREIKYEDFTPSPARKPQLDYF